MSSASRSLDELLTVARRVLSGDLSVLVAARQIASLTHHIDPDMRDPDLRFFVGVDSETDALPLGPERELWDREALAQKDVAIRRAEAFYKDAAATACRALIQRYAQGG